MADNQGPKVPKTPPPPPPMPKIVTVIKEGAKPKPSTPPRDK